MDIWLVLNSNGCDEYYPENTAFQFTSHLKCPLVLDGYWTVGLYEFYADRQINTKPRNKDNLLYIYCSLCEPIIVDGDRRPLLRRIIKSKTNGWNVVFDRPMYIKTQASNTTVNKIELNIVNSLGEPASFLKKPVTVTLHLKPVTHI